MKMTFQKLVIGASMAIGVSAIATAPAHATSFSFNNANEINTYTGGSNGSFIANNTVAASQALNDGDVSSNVELWYTDENPTSNVGFTATQGNYSATVSSVTASDWSSFGSQWLSSLLSTYTPFQSLWNGFSANTQSLITSSLPSLGIGDPNIGSFQFDQNGGVQLSLVGDLDVKARLSATINTNLNAAWNKVSPQFPANTPAPTLSQVNTLIPQLQSQLTAIPGQILLAQSQLSQLAKIPQTSAAISTIAKLNAQITQATTLQGQLSDQITQLTSYKDLLNFQAAVNAYQGQIGASEIAKVVDGTNTYYAYSFNPMSTGITASDDHVSYSAYYTWNTPGYTDPTKQVPEPSIILGLLGVAGVFATQRKFKKASI
ncbi:MAG: NF038130 family PEP-CTERM protein [Nostoc sp.]|uniref:NF038130 family PEP-CTERM protein n=1 Tax=Nostoc sp. TaxID=1180 RepID=UPI002FF5002B